MALGSLKVVYRKDRVKKDGSTALYLQVIIGREVSKISLDVSWPIQFWDEKKNLCKARFKNDTQCNDINLVIRDNLSRANEIFIQYRLRRIGISLEMFLREFANNLSKDDFLMFMEQKILSRYKDREIELGTKKAHMVTLNHLKKWKKSLKFSDLDDQTAQRFDNFLIKKSTSQAINSRWGQHKNFKTYLSLAKKERVNFINPYDFYHARSENGRFLPLTQPEFLELWNFYNGLECIGTEREVVRAFLFTCVTGMRHSDVRRVLPDWINGEFFEFIPHKTRRFGTKIRFPITSESLGFLADEIDEVGKYPLFSRISEQKQNSIIKEISRRIKISCDVCFQVGRETFATLYMENDGKLEVLAAFLGHTSTKMSEKYIKIRDQRKKEESHRISSFFIDKVKH